jgi:Glycosyltransferase family 87
MQKMARSLAASASHPQLVVVGAWVLSRLIMLALAIAFEWRVCFGDLAYYWTHLGSGGGFDPAAEMREYPVPVLWLLRPPALITSDVVGYGIVTALTLMILDALFTAYVTFRAERGPQIALGWTLLTFLLGPLTYMRFDLVTSMMLAVSLIEYRRRPALAGAALAVAAALKLWPALAVVAFVGMSRPALRRLFAGLAITGVVLVGLSLAYAGVGRLLSPLSYQADRGLNVDSVWATLPMLARVTNFSGFPVAVSRFAAFEITGPGVPLWLGAASASALVGVLVLLWLGIRVVRNRLDDAATVAGLAVLATLVLIVTNKTLSPQYLTWLAGSVPILVAWLPNRIGRLTVAGVAIITVLTHVTYPLMAGMFTTGGPGIKLAISTCTMATRNVLLVVLSVWFLAQLVARTSAQRIPDAT